MSDQVKSNDHLQLWAHSHVWCNNRDYGWRTQIRTMLAKGKSLADIAEALNSKGVPPAHGTNRWTAAMVRKAYVS